MRILRAELKVKANAAFRQNWRLSEMTPGEREEAADYYESIALEVGGLRSGLAKLYNLERAKFLRGEVSRIASKAILYAREIGYGD